MRYTICLSLSLLAVALGLPVRAEDEVAMQTLVSGLKNPSGITVHPTTGEVYVSDSAAGRVIRFNKNHPNDVADVVTGYGKDVYGKGPMYDIGPLGLAFLNRDHLIVGGGEQKDGMETIRVFQIKDANATLSLEDAKYVLGPISPSEKSKMGEGNFYAIAASSRGIFATSNGDDTKGWVVRSVVMDNTPEALEPFIATKEAVQVDAPVGITFSPDGKLVVSQMGEVAGTPKDSLLTVYDPQSGKLLVSAPTGLFDIAGLAYSPKTGKLYAVDYAWMDSKEGGLFRLDVTGAGENLEVTAVKLAKLDRPSAIAFDGDGTLFVTVFGEKADGSTPETGAVLCTEGL